jgi:hypothetical protein
VPRPPEVPPCVCNQNTLQYYIIIPSIRSSKFLRSFGDLSSTHVVQIAAKSHDSQHQRNDLMANCMRLGECGSTSHTLRNVGLIQSHMKYILLWRIVRFKYYRTLSCKSKRAYLPCLNFYHRQIATIYPVCSDLRVKVRCIQDADELVLQFVTRGISITCLMRRIGCLKTTSLEQPLDQRCCYLRPDGTEISKLKA